MTKLAAEGTVVWVTRPATQAGELVALLQAGGCRVYAQPVLAIEEIDPSGATAAAALAVLSQAAACDFILFVSANAARIGLAWLRRAAQLPLSSGTRVCAVGPATAEVLEPELGPVLIPDGDYTSEGLLARPELQRLAGNKILIVRGVGGRSLLAEELRRRGAEVSVAELYRRVAPAALDPDLLAGLQSGRVDAIMAASGETIGNLLELGCIAGDQLQRVAVVVPGQRVADLATARGFRRVVVANSAVAADMARAWLDYGTGAVQKRR